MITYGLEKIFVYSVDTYCAKGPFQQSVNSHFLQNEGLRLHRQYLLAAEDWHEGQKRRL